MSAPSHDPSHGGPGPGGAGGPWGLLAEFATPEALVEAARRTRQAGYTRIDAFTPYPVEGLWHALKYKRSKVPLVVLLGGICGGLGVLALQYWSMVVRYPMIIGGRPNAVWPAWVVPTFEGTILCAAISGVIGMILLNGLPRPHHPVFNVERFARASQDGYFLAIEAGDPKFERWRTTEFLRGLGPVEVSEVED